MFRKFGFVFYIFVFSFIIFSCASVPDNRTTLITLVEENKVEEVKNLFSVKEDANQKNETGETPLHIAAKQNNTEMTRLLLSFDTLIDERDNNGNTPLMSALKAGSLNTANILCQAGAGVFVPDNEGRMPWQIAFSDTGDAIKSLIKWWILLMVRVIHLLLMLMEMQNLIRHLLLHVC